MLVYTIKWKDYGLDKTNALGHDFLINEPGGPAAILAWQQGQSAIPVQSPIDSAARHWYWGQQDAAPSLLQHDPPAPRAPAPPSPFLSRLLFHLPSLLFLVPLSVPALGVLLVQPLASRLDTRYRCKEANGGGIAVYPLSAHRRTPSACAP
jgi:hypothetical protein